MGKDFGFVQDVCADLETGVITSIIVPGNNKFLNIFAGNNDIEIPAKNKMHRRWPDFGWNLRCLEYGKN